MSRLWKMLRILNENVCLMLVFVEELGGKISPDTYLYFIIFRARMFKFGTDSAHNSPRHMASVILLIVSIVLFNT